MARPYFWRRQGVLRQFSAIALMMALGLTFTACTGGQPLQQSTKLRATETQLAAAETNAVGNALAGPGSSYGAYLAGLYAGYQRDLSAASDFMLRALSDDPENRRLLDRSLMLVAGNGHHNKAVELAQRLTDVVPDHAMANLVLAVDAVNQGAFADADKILKALPDRGLNAITIPLLRGWLLVAQGQVDEGLQLITSRREKSGLGALYALHLALINDQAGRSEDTLTAYDAAVAAAAQPTLRLTWLMGNFLERNGQTAKAIELYRHFKDKSPNSTLMDAALARATAGRRPSPVIADATHGLAEVFFNLAGLLSREQAEDAALLHIQMALRLNPDFAIARVMLGEILQNQNRSDEAIAVYRQIPDDTPFTWMVRLRIAEELQDLGKSHEAIATLEKLAEDRPKEFEPLFRIGNIFRDQKRNKEAVAAYDRAVARIEELRPRHWRLLYFRGIALESLKLWPQAESDFLRALQLEPEQPYVLNFLAYSWVEKKLHLDKAREMLTRAVTLRPGDGYIVDSLGWVLYRLGEYGEAVSSLERAVELQPQDPIINDHLGDAYWKVGRHHEARFQWRRALSLKPEGDVAPSIEAKIERGLSDQPNDT